ncbi:MAG TPA: septum formation inhibitor Maf [Campylobacterales bacterium]|nr:septum formation inhibitor Maf [Campylobacterales bacterium]
MIHLASNSQSRALLLKKAHIPFIQKAPEYDEEQITTSVAKDFVYIASQGKLNAAIREFGLGTPLLTADSVIATNEGQILRKPKDIDDARRILGLQSDAKIAIISAMHYKTSSFYLSDVSATYYTFEPFDPHDLENYLQSGAWQGKAGGCMVEGFCKKYIRKVHGYESTAMGLSVERLQGWLENDFRQ